ncbi:tyrosine-type recombinase/integrase family protein [Bifidobacterium dentium]|uniref:tyrosine-type recombinase/integrase n=1 Tax=Bifidobacterium dentium TaxID=1689 RepID=UPI0018C2F838|nr:site-specific integrase [Bifidobacterium dentium]MBF9699068.1 tyrosine-type recombinase/integrase family protein [Bifidobacterium dentium]
MGYSKWPDLPRHYTKNFDADYTAMAEAWLAEQERLIKLGSWEPPRIEKTKELSSTITFREYALDFVQNRRKPNGQRIAPTTREKYLQYLNDYLLPVLGDKPMGSIGPRDVERWADSMSVGKAGEGASVKHKAYVLLREIFRDACERELDQDGTTLLTSNPVHIQVRKPAVRFQFVDFGPGELKTLYRAMPPRFAVLIYLIGAMALRPGEAYGLQRRDVKLKDDLSGGEINIVRAAKEYREKDSETGKIRKRILVNSTKTEGSERQVLLPPYVCKALDQHLRSFVADRPDAYLFTSPKTGDVVNAQTVRNAWYRARKSVPLLEEKKAPLYDLRHRAITHMAAYTKSDKTVMDMAGHSRSDTDLYYQHAINSEKEKVVDGIEDEVRDYEAGQSFENHMTDGEGGKSDSAESVARLLDRVGTGTRMELLKAMGDEERGR